MVTGNQAGNQIAPSSDQSLKSEPCKSHSIHRETKSVFCLESDKGSSNSGKPVGNSGKVVRNHSETKKASEKTGKVSRNNSEPTKGSENDKETSTVPPVKMVTPMKPVKNRKSTKTENNEAGNQG